MLHRTLRLAAIFAVAFFGATAGAADFSARDVYREASSSVVMVYARLGTSTSSSGTGTVVGERGLVLTNGHVVSDAGGVLADEIAVFFKPARLTGDLRQDLAEGQRAKVVARSLELDLVLLEVEGGLPSGVTPVAFADSDEIEIGERVAAIGHPGGGGLWTLTTGTISSARKRGDLDVFQTDAALNPGNSGGPLLDADARVVGLNTFVVRMSDSGLPLEGLNYSLRANAVRRWLGHHDVAVVVRDRSERIAAAAPAPVVPPAASPAPPSPPATPEDTPRSDPREFRGPRGEAMYGLPDRDFSFDAVDGALYGATRDRAEDAFRELDAEF